MDHGIKTEKVLASDDTKNKTLVGIELLYKTFKNVFSHSCMEYLML